MDAYLKSYALLVCEISKALDALEPLAERAEMPDEVRRTLQQEVDRLGKALADAETAYVTQCG